MERKGFAFTGASSQIYSLDETKARMKQHLVSVNAVTPGYLDLVNVGEQNKDEIIAALGRLKMPVLIKPSESRYVLIFIFFRLNSICRFQFIIYTPLTKPVSL